MICFFDSLSCSLEEPYVFYSFDTFNNFTYKIYYTIEAQSLLSDESIVKRKINKRL